MEKENFIELVEPSQLPMLCQQMLKGYLWFKRTIGGKHEITLTIDRLVVYGRVQTRAHAVTPQTGGSRAERVDENRHNIASR